ncbi:MAG: hypothetical protein QOI02_629 [Actinomycetota bacterium]|nr:hypothetical protein [Actinomycetota bacterium]
MTTPYAQPATPAENVVRGTLFALIAIPAGVIVFDLLWFVGFIASIVTFGVAILATWLYRKGSGGVISRNGAWALLAIIAVTVALSLFTGLFTDFTRLAVNETGMSVTELLGNPNFWPNFTLDLPENIKANGLSLAIAIAFGIMGAFSTLRQAFRTARLHDPAPTDGVYPTTATVVPTAAPAGTVEAPPAVAPTDPGKPDAGSAGPIIH